jgi:hypothetical protein
MWSTVLIQKRRKKFKALALLKSMSQEEFSKTEKKSSTTSKEFNESEN